MRLGQAKIAPPILILVLATTLAPAGMNILAPSTPGIAAGFDTPISTAQWTMTLYLIGISAGQLIYGPFSDRFGRRPVLLFGLSVFGFASFAGTFATSIDTLILSRLMQALGACAGTVIVRAIVRDVYDREKATSVLGYIAMTMVMGPAIAPAIGGYIDQLYNWRVVMAFLGIVASLVVLFSLKWLHETHHHRTGTLNFMSVIRDYRQLITMPAFVGYAILVGLSAAMFFTFLTSAAHLSVEIFSVGPDGFGIYFLIVGCGFASGSFFAGRLSHRLTSTKMVVLGICLSGLGSGAMALFWTQDEPEIIHMFMVMATITFGNGILQPGAIAGAVSQRPDIAGAASGLLGFIQMSIAALATFTAGLFLAETAAPMLWQFSTIIGIMLICFAIAVRFDQAR